MPGCEYFVKGKILHRNLIFLSCRYKRVSFERMHNEAIQSRIVAEPAGDKLRLICDIPEWILCNGNILKWNAEFRCLNETDFNYLSTFQEIIELATRESCNIGFYSNLNPDCLAESDKMISTWDVSDSKLKYDKQIDKAIQSS